MNKKLKIGDKFIWHSFVGMSEKEFTILDIDISGTSRTIYGTEIKCEILLQWKDAFGNKAQTWVGDYDILNNILNRGGITIVGESMKPVMNIKKFTL
jgi:hypothetical protein